MDQYFGWIDSPEEVAKVIASLSAPFFAQAAPHLAQSWDGVSNIKLWDFSIKALGKHLTAHKQGIGDCVSHGHGAALDTLQCINSVVNDTDFQLGKHECFTEAIYGQMRKRAHQLSMNDGAVGAWAVQSLAYDGYPQRNGREYDPNRAKYYGYSGTPDEVVVEGSEFKLAQYLQVTTTREAADLLHNGYPITVCSRQGFTLVRDQNGVCQPEGVWPHCMFCNGLIQINGTAHFNIVQSWGQNMPSGPTIENMPDNSFLAHETVFQRMLDCRDSWALTSVPGFPKRSIFYV